MKCKFCDSELVEGKRFCPNCGKDQVEETVAEEAVSGEAVAETAAAPEIKENVKATPGKIALAIAAGVVVLALLVALVLSGVDGDLFETGSDVPESTAAPVETEPAETVPATIPPDGNPEDVTCKGTYSATEEEVAAAAGAVVATVGGQELTNGLLQAYYWDCIYAFLQDYGSYASMFGLDYNQSLDTQLCEMGDISMTWQQYFLQYALDTWHSHQAVTLEGIDNGYELEADLVDAMNQLYLELEEASVGYGYENLDDFMYDYMAPGCTYDNYKRYMELYYRGYGYLDYVYLNTAIEPAQVEAYFQENEAAYVDSGISKDGGKYVDVRHILLTPEGETNEEGAYSEAQWEACRQAAQDMLDGWLAGEATEESFAQLAETHSTDPGSNTNGGLYEDVYEGQMVPEFNAWCFDETREYGNYGLVKTDYGYHIMFFVGSQDIWYATAEADMISDKVSAVVPAAMEKYPMTVDYSAIKLGVVDFTSG